MNDADSLKPDAESEVAALLCRLQVTQRRLEELTGGTLDKVKDAEREAAEMQMAILNALPAHIALIDGSGVILSVNDAWRRFASTNVIQRSDFFVGQNYLEVCERAVGDCSSEAREAAVGIRQVLQGEIKEFSLEYPCHSPTELLWFRLMVTPLREDSRLGAVVMHVNVTEQRVAEEALRGSEQRLNFALEAAKIGDWNLNFTTNDIHRSLRHDQCFGYTEAVDDWSQDTFLNHVDELDRERVAASFEKAKSGKGNYDEEFRTTWPDGSVHWLWTKGQIYFDAADRPTRAAGIVTDITERKLANETLKRVLERLNEAQRIGTIGDWEWDIVTQKITWSPQVYDIFGRDPRQGPPRDYEDQRPLFEDASWQLLREKVALALESGEEQEYELVVLRPDGEQVDVQARAVPRKDENGKVIALYGTIQDISLRKRGELALRESEERFRSLFQNVSTVAVQSYLADGTTLSWNHASELLYGYTVEEAVGKNLIDLLLPPEVKAEYQAALQQMAESGEPVASSELTLRRKDSSEVTVFSSYAAVRIPGRPTELFCIDVDLTERKLAEEALRASELEFRTLTEAMPQIVWVTRADGWNTYFSQQWIEYTGMTLEESVGHGWNKPFHPEDQQRARDAWQTATATKSIYSIESRLRRADGTYRWWLVRGVPHRDYNGEIVKWFGTCTDIHDLKLAEIEVARSNRALKMLSACNEALFRAENEQGLLEQVCHIAVEDGGYRMAWVGYAKNDEACSIVSMAHAGVEEGYLSEIKVTWNASESSGQGPAGQVIRTSQAVVSRDISEDARFAPWRDPAQRRGYRGIICLPLRDATHTFGLVGLYTADVLEKSAEELKLLQDLADDLAFGIYNLRIRVQQQRTHEAVLTMAKGLSASPGREFFENLTISMVKALGAQAGFIAQVLPSVRTVHTMCAVVGEKIVPNFEYNLVGAPCENLGCDEISIVPRDATQLYPGASIQNESEIQGYVCAPLVDAAGRMIGILFVQFIEPMEQEDLVSSTIKIFAARAASEMERQDAEARTREQAALLDKSPDAIIVRDLNHGIKYWNKSAERLYGWTAEEVLGKSVRDLLYRDTTFFVEGNRKVLENGEWIGELDHLTKDGSPVKVEARWTLVKDDLGCPKSILAINTDIRERKKIEQQFLRSQRMESLGTLAGGIAHDLNNSLAPIIMSLELLKMKFPDEESQKLLSVINTSAQRGAEMVQQVLSFARGVEGRRIGVQVRHLLRDVEKITKETFLKHIQIGVIVPKDLWSVLGDPTQLHQVLLNLCVNARDAMPDGGDLTVSAQNILLDAQYAGLSPDATPGPHILIQIEDTGTGIPAEIIEKIFDPFFTTKEFGKGTGLGLSTSIAIVKSHGGFMRVSSEPGKGTNFSVYLPAQTEAPENPRETVVEMPRGNGELILVVDDEAAVRQITQQTLETFGYRVLLAHDGSEAVSLYAARGAEIAVVITDMMMPVMAGPATIRVLQILNPAVKIVGASGLSTSSHVEQALGMGITHFLPKPYTAETLLKILNVILARSA